MGRILDEFCQTAGLHRKAAIRLLGRGRGLAAVPKKGRPPRYGPEVTETLVKVWEAGDRMCGKLLAAGLPALMEGLERHGELCLSASVREALVSMSAATIDRQLRNWRKGLGRPPRRPASGLRPLQLQGRPRCPRAPVRTHPAATELLRPVRKLIGKERHGSRVRKVYDAPRTPYQRVLESGLLGEAAAERLKEQFLSINPAELQRRIELALRGI
jgi:hypothetical protein